MNQQQEPRASTESPAGSPEMTAEPSPARVAEDAPRKPIRLWPGLVAVALQWLGRFVLPALFPETLLYGMLGEIFWGLVIALWWVFFSRAPRSERWGAVVLAAAALICTPFILDESMASGMMGMLFPIYVIPILSLAFVAWAVVSRRFSDGLRRATLVAAILIACGVFALFRTAGMTGDANSDFAWRWSKTPEDRLMAQAGNNPAAPRSAPAVENTEPPTSAPSWPGFRGPGRNSIIRGVRIDTDWNTAPPVELWRRKVGPGWSSFAVQGDLLYTQEQRGEDEVVACYEASSGKPVWKHRDPARFWESNAGAGPRGTPTLSEGHVYALGATGIMNALDARDGSVLWSRNAAADTDVKVPGWGFSGSPLVMDDLVIVATAGTLVAYQRDSGEPRWIGPKGGGGYSSPHLLSIDGVNQVVLMSSVGATSFTPADGTVLWQFPLPSTSRILQPALIPDGDILVSEGDSKGLRRVAITHESGEWRTKERWTSIRLKPYFNDFVVHEGYAYGFDGSILACMDLANGERKWKGGRFGHGQFVLLADQDLLLVLSERGELALVRATPDPFTELARFPAIEGKTWNHPVLVDDLLLVRNGREMAAFRLSPQKTDGTMQYNN